MFKLREMCPNSGLPSPWVFRTLIRVIFGWCTGFCLNYCKSRIFRTPKFSYLEGSEIFAHILNSYPLELTTLHHPCKGYMKLEMPLDNGMNRCCPWPILFSCLLEGLPLLRTWSTAHVGQQCTEISLLTLNVRNSACPI